jgi:hypothetical protein
MFVLSCMGKVLYVCVVLYGKSVVCLCCPVREECCMFVLSCMESVVCLCCPVREECCMFVLSCTGRVLYVCVVLYGKSVVCLCCPVREVLYVCVVLYGKCCMFVLSCTGRVLHSVPINLADTSFEISDIGPTTLVPTAFHTYTHTYLPTNINQLNIIKCLFCFEI